MPTLKEITDDIQLILEKGSPSDDFRITTKMIQRQVAKYRSRGIRETYMRNREMNLTWLQELGNVEFTRVTPDDDPNVSGCKCILGKYRIPTVVSLPDDKGVYRVSSACRTKKFYPTTIERFMGFVEGSIRARQNYYFRVGNSLYIHPFIKNGSMQMVLDNPLDGYKIQSEKILSGNLLSGDAYTVTGGSIVHNSVTYTKGMAFTAANTTFTGSGIVKYTDEKRKLNSKDSYPLDDTMMEYIVIKILSQEFKVEESKIADIRNDSQDESSRLQAKR